MGNAHLPRFSLYYPRSFLKLITVGFMLVALPLILAIGNNALSIHEIAERGQRTVHQAIRATEASRMLMEQITAMERSVRQSSALGDGSLLEGYEHSRAKFLEGAQRMAALHLDFDQTRLLGVLRERESGLHHAVATASATPDALAHVLNEFDALQGIAQSLADLGNAVVEREVAGLQSMSEGVKRFVFWQLAALVPVALLLLVGAIILISRPIAQIDAAIRRLGEGDFEARVEVSGPQDLRHLGRQLDWMRLRLIELEEEKQRFLHHVSHELKTPLAALREGTDLLHEQVVGALDPAQREVVGILRQNTQRMQELIEGLLHYHEAQFQRSAPAPVAVELAELIAAVARQHRLTLASKHLHLAIDCPDITLEGDREKLAAILGNLLSNAIKFSPRDGTIRIAAASDGTTIRLEVRDEGPGILPEERERVFEPFFQGSARQDGPVKGTGLGLAIVREFAAAHGGRVELAPTDKGTCMVVELPRERVVPSLPALPRRAA